MRNSLCRTALSLRSHAHAVVSPRSGFTLAELIVGIVLLTVGVGALSSTAAWVLYQTAATRRAERAAGLGRTRLELLRLGPCSNGSGSIDHEGLTERWTVSATPYGASVAVTITYAERGREIAQRYQGGFTC
jgi:prepilin-type N-terminal cleavage/methylation domain-containing protein